MNEPNVYLNGRMIPAHDAHLEINDLGVVLGATVAEMLRTFHQRLYRLEDHLGRLARSIERGGFEVPVSMAELGKAAEELVEHNAQLAPPGQELGLVIFITAGPSPTYAVARPVQPGPTVCAHTFALPLWLWAGRVRRGVHLVIPATRHVPPQCLDPNVKHRSRLHYYLADQEARRVDPEAIPLLVDLEGHVTETSTANFLLVQDGTIVSPPREHVLPGISREVVGELAAGLGIPFAERPITPVDVEHADEALLSSTPFCLAPAVRIDGRPIGSGQPGPVFRRLVEAWSHEVGLDILAQIEAAAPGPPSPLE